MRQESPDEKQKLIVYGKVIGVLSRLKLLLIFN